MGRRALLSAMVFALLAAPAQAAYTGSNGKIVFERTTGFGSPQQHIHVINADGTGNTQLTTVSPSRSPAWSADGNRIAFVQGNTIMTMDETGGDLQPVFSWPNGIGQPDWSPDGQRLAIDLQVCEADECRFDVHTVKLDGTDLVDITPDLIDDRNPAWTPDGTKIAFNSSKGDNGQDIWTVEPDGSAATLLHSNSLQESDPDWSPGGERFLHVRNETIVRLNSDGTRPFVLHPGAFPAWSPDNRRFAWARAQADQPPVAGCTRYALWVGDPDSFQSSTAQQITGPHLGECTNDISPDWQPRPPENGYARPKGASPVDVSLALAFQACDGASANRVHGPPLEHESCSPPERELSSLTVGTADSNGQPTKSVSRLLIGVLAGNPSTAADEADLRLSGAVNDVRLASDLSDYNGTLEARMTLRITDKDNTPNYGGGPASATLEDTTYSFTWPCAATADTTVGSDCNVETTAEALVPGVIKEGRRAVWQLGQVEVRDGSGGTFMRQGIFVP